MKPKGRGKGYTTPWNVRAKRRLEEQLEKGKINRATFNANVAKIDAEVARREQHVTRLHGIVGTVAGFAAKVDARLMEIGLNWGRLAEQVHCSRQYLVDACAKDQIPMKFYLLVCQALQVDPSEWMTETTE